MEKHVIQKLNDFFPYWYKAICEYISYHFIIISLLIRMGRKGREHRNVRSISINFNGKIVEIQLNSNERILSFIDYLYQNENSTQPQEPSSLVPEGENKELPQEEEQKENYGEQINLL